MDGFKFGEAPKLIQKGSMFSNELYFEKSWSGSFGFSSCSRSF